jgi:hypothetical protein
LGLPSVAGGREKRQGQLQVNGKTVSVEPTQVTIQDAQGQTVTVICKEDFTLKVAVGSEVTAWYTPKDGVNHLEWLEYPLENFFLPAEQIRRRIKKVLILPSYGVPDSQELVNRIAGYLESNLGWYMAPGMLAEEIRRRSHQLTSTLDAIDPATGQFDAKRYLDSQRQLIERLASETRVNAVLGVTVEQVQAKFVDQVAVWDGVVEPVASKMTRYAARLTPFTINGNVPAATVEMKLWDSHGKLLWSNRRGFAVLSVLSGFAYNFRERPLTEVYQNEAGVSEWLAAALGTLVASKTVAATAPVSRRPGSNRLPDPQGLAKAPAPRRCQAFSSLVHTPPPRRSCEACNFPSSWRVHALWQAFQRDHLPRLQVPRSGRIAPQEGPS